jgi:hypothetical protein
VTLEIIDVESGETIRRYSSEDEPEPFIEGRNTPDYWLRPDQRLAATPGLHRFTWDLRFAPPPTDRPTYPISAVPGNTPRVPHGLWVRPGTYQVRLTAADQTLRQAVVVRMDPRVQSSMADLERQFTLSRSLDRAMRRLDTERATLTDPAAAAAIGQRMAQMLRLFQTLQQADARPTAAQEAAVAALIGSSQGGPKFGPPYSSVRPTPSPEIHHGDVEVMEVRWPRGLSRRHLTRRRVPTLEERLKCSRLRVRAHVGVGGLRPPAGRARR